MAIGNTLPPRQVPRDRLVWRSAGTVFAHQAIVLKASILRVVSTTRVLWKRLANGVKDLLSPRARARQRQRAQFNAFERHYEGLVDLLCAAAHEGIHPERERSYRRARSWMAVNYPSMARNVRCHLETEVPDGPDPFEALYSYACLAEAVNVDTGIDDILRSRAALEAYRIELDSLGI